MKVSPENVVYVAGLAHLDLSEQERARMLRDLNSILEYIDRLNQLDTAGIEPMAQVSDRYGKPPARAGSSEHFGFALREDRRAPSWPRERVLENAPQADGAFFRVPKVIER